MKKRGRSSNQREQCSPPPKVSLIPLAKCPKCPKTFPRLVSLFGHFGASHSKTGGRLNQDEIIYMCPQCTTEESSSVDIIRDHMVTHHGVPVESEDEEEANRPTDPDDDVPVPDEVPEAVTSDAVSSAATIPLRKSQRTQTHIVTTNRYNNKNTSPAQPTSQTRYHCPRCYRIFNKQGLTTHHAMVHGTLNWDHVQISQIHPGDLGYVCPDCFRVFSKKGLTTHHGMTHHSLLRWEWVQIVSGDGSVRKDNQKDMIEEEEEVEGPVRKSRRISQRARIGVGEERYNEEKGSIVVAVPPSLNFGPWTKEEHMAFLTGHGLHGNQWIRISEEFVPTRTPKQIGSHALAHFTSAGQWEEKKKWSRSAEEEEEQSAGPVKHVLLASVKVDHLETTEDETEVTEYTKLDEKAPRISEDSRIQARLDSSPKKETGHKRNVWTAEEHAAFIEGHKQLGNSWYMISQRFVPFRTPKQVGSHAFHFFKQKGAWEEAKKTHPDPAIYEDGGATMEETEDPSDDGNFDYCIVCEDGGNLVCCSNCPRAYHSFCIHSSNGSPPNVDTLPQNWVCERCNSDKLILSKEEIVEAGASPIDFQSTYSNLNHCDGFDDCCKILAKLYLIVCKLKETDYGYIFSEAVDQNIVPDYLSKISSPMDYGTILNKFETGEYGKCLKPLMKRPMEAILLQFIHDIELVHNNCLQYNPRGSSVYRAGQTQSKKWDAFFNRYLIGSLSEVVIESYHKGALDAEQWPKKDEELKAPATSKITESVEEANDSSDQQQETPKTPKVKRVKTSDSRSQSSGVLFTREQLDAFGRVFFSSSSDLNVSIINTDKNCRIQRSQWYDRLEDLRKYKLTHGTAVVSISIDDKLYHWNSRQRKRYHLTFFQNPDFKTPRYLNISEEDKTKPDIIWLTTRPSMKGVFSLTASNASNRVASRVPSIKNVPNFIEELNVSTEVEVETAELISEMHKQTLYHTRSSVFPHRNSSSLFWDETLEDLRFYRGDHQHTIVPRSLPHNSILSMWVEIQRAKLLLFFIGIDSGLLGSQIFVLDDELKIYDFSNSPLAAASSDATTCCSKINIELNARDGLKPNDVVRENELATTDHSKPPATPSSTTVDTLCTEMKRTPSDLSPQSGINGKSQLPLSKCPICDKTFHSLRKLYGHFGSAHSRNTGLKINRDDVKFACPFCCSTRFFTLLKELESHVNSTHPDCELLKSEFRFGTVSAVNKLSNSTVQLKTKSLFKRQLAGFVEWHQHHSSCDLESMSKDLYTWCRRQCNAASAVLVGTPNISGVKMNATKLNILASSGFFRCFLYNDKRFVPEDEYEGSEEWEVAFDMLEAFANMHGSTVIPDYHDCTPSVLTWISEMETNLIRFTRGKHCDLSIQQIEKLVLIGFCTDRSNLPNLSKSDITWLRKFSELRRYQILFGDCHVSEDFPQLHQWVTDQRVLFRQFQLGKKELMKIERQTMLMDLGLDLFTGDYIPHVTQDELVEYEQLISTSPLSYSWNSKTTATIGRHQGSSNDDFFSRFQNRKFSDGHCLLSADEDTALYRWLIAMRSALLESYASKNETDCRHSLLHHFVLRFVKDKDVRGPDEHYFKTRESLVLWMKYSERFMMFKALSGHCIIPTTYPDVALLHWVRTQQEELYLHCSGRSTHELPLHLKLLVSLGLSGKKRDVQVTMSSRTLTRNVPGKYRSK